jgi:hypothetical protein
MTQAQAESIANSIIANNLNATAVLQTDGSWHVLASAPGFTIPALAAANVATAAGVQANVAVVEFS